MRTWRMHFCSNRTPARAHLQGWGGKGRAWNPRIPSPRPRRPRPNKFLGRSLLGPLGALGALGTDSALHGASGHHSVPDLRPHRGGLAHVVCPVAARLASPRGVPWAALLRTHGPATRTKLGYLVAPHAPRAPRLQPPEPPRSATPASGRAPPPGPTPRTRAAGRHSPALTVSLLRGHGRYRRSPLRPGARSAGPVRELRGSRARRARRAPARRARSPGP